MAAIAPWRLNLQPASYNGAGFFVDVDTKSGGRRIVVHEYPKKDVPYSEDMGRRAKRFSITAYVIGPDFEDARDALVEQLEALGNGILVRPTTSDQATVVVETYNITERRERGGYAVFDIAFIEAGQKLASQTDSRGAITGAADGAVPKASSLSGNDFSGSSDITQLA